MAGRSLLMSGLRGIVDSGPAWAGIRGRVHCGFCFFIAGFMGSVERARGDFGDDLIVQRLDAMLTSCGGVEGMLTKLGEEIGTQEDSAT